jgi:hypothetical protein
VPESNATLDLFGGVFLPEGMKYQPEFLSADEERALLADIEKLPFREFEFRGFTGKSRTISFGRRYDVNGGGLTRTDDMPEFLTALRTRAEALAGPCVSQLPAGPRDRVRARRRHRLAQGSLRLWRCCRHFTALFLHLQTASIVSPTRTLVSPARSAQGQRSMAVGVAPDLSRGVAALVAVAIGVVVWIIHMGPGQVAICLKRTKIVTLTAPKKAAPAVGSRACWSRAVTMCKALRDELDRREA